MPLYPRGAFWGVYDGLAGQSIGHTWGTKRRRKTKAKISRQRGGASSRHVRASPVITRLAQKRPVRARLIFTSLNPDSAPWLWQGHTKVVLW